MKEFKGTPGPWVADKTSRAIGPISHDDDQSYGILIPVAWVEFDQDEGIKASNQRLIAAAPELLEALKKMVSKAYKQNWNDAYPEEIQSAQAAINKALGEKQ
ncbi:hypothetical protein [Escherichia phage BUCT618]|nr:hypothetical protein [Escherichia phage BUCT618]